jgi:phosphoglycerate dehydrogenase-like enzyme
VADAPARPAAGARAPRPAVAVLRAPDKPKPPGLERVAALAEIRDATSPEEVPRAVCGAEVLLLWDFRATMLRDAWTHARDLRWIHSSGAGVDAVLFPELVASDVVLTNSRGIYDRAIAEYVLGLMLVFAKDLWTTADLQRRREWRYRETELVADRRVLIVGAGGIGRAIARLARAAGMRPEAVARTGRTDPELGRITPVAKLHDVLGEADYVVIAAPLTPETRGLFDAAAFRRMKPTARLINIGRGAIVDEAALAGALRARRIAGAALDVFMQEPLPEAHPFWDLPGLVVSPHMCGDYHGWTRAVADLFVENYLRWRRGEPLLNVVDKRLGYISSAPPPPHTAAAADPPGPSGASAPSAADPGPSGAFGAAHLPPRRPTA